MWRFMQTDPNFGNFLYDDATGRLALIDFGAARAFPKPFVDDYLRMVKACAEEDREEIIHRSTVLGFLTGASLRNQDRDQRIEAVLAGLPPSFV